MSEPRRNRWATGAIAVVATSALLVAALPAPLIGVASAGEDPPAADEAPSESADADRSGTWVGRVDGTEVAVALVTNGKKVWAYACDGASTSAFFKGDLVGNSFLVAADNGATISGGFQEGDAQGTFSSPDGSIVGAFTAKRPVAGGGLFTSEFNTEDGSRVALRWIVADDGTQRGNTETTTGGETATTPAPPLPVDAAREQATVPLDVAGGPVPVNELNPASLGGPVPTSTAPLPPPPPSPDKKPLVVAAKVDPPKAEVGTPVRYQLTLTNPNQAELTGAGVGVGFPPALTFQPATEKTTCKGQFVAFPPGVTKPGEPQLVVSGVTLAAGASCTADVAVVASTPAAVDVVTNPPTAQGAPPGVPVKVTFVIGATAVTPGPTTTTKPPTTTTKPPTTTTKPPATTTTQKPGNPSAPRQVTARALPLTPGADSRSGQVEVSFQAPEKTGGSPIVGFTAGCALASQPLGGTFVSGSASPLTVSGLAVGTEFACFVVAVNQAGQQSPPAQAQKTVTVTSTPATTTTTTTRPPTTTTKPATTTTKPPATTTTQKPGNPSEPRKVTARALPVRAGDGPFAGRVEVSFEAPEKTGGSPIVGFDATCALASQPLGGSFASGKASPLTVSGLAFDTEFACFVIAVNQAGRRSAPVRAQQNVTVSSTPPATTTTTTTPRATTATAPPPVKLPPSPPRKVVVDVPVSQPTDGPNDGRIQVSFDVPERDGGSPITGFEAACTDNVNVQENASGTASPLTVTGLPTPGTYVCFVRAENAVGAGDIAESKKIDVPLPPSVVVPPSAPRDVKAEVLPFEKDDGGGDGRIKVSFQVPEKDGGSAITNFDVACTDNVNFSFNASGPASPLTVTGVAAGFSYECFMLAENVAGPSDLSKPSNKVGVPLPPSQKLPPSAPRNVVAEALPPQETDGQNDGRIRVSFQVPEKDGGAKVTGFEVACSDGSVVQVNANGTASPITVTGVPVGLTYECFVRAVNNVGPGDLSKVSNTVDVPLPASVKLPPTAPRNVKAKALDPKPGDDPGDGRIVVTFVVPEKDGGSAITSYEVACSDNRSFQVNASGKGSPITVTGVQAGLTYECVMRAENDIGPGGLSKPSNTVKVPLPPVVPTLVATPPSGSAPLPVTFALENPPEKIASWTLDFGDGTGKVTGEGAFPAVPHTFVNKTDQVITLNAALEMTPQGEKGKLLRAPVQVHPAGTTLIIDGTPDPQTFRRGSGGKIDLAVRNPNATPVAGPLTVPAPSSIKVTFAGTGWTCTETACTLPAGLEGFAAAPLLAANLVAPADAPATLEVPFEVSAASARAQKTVRIPVVGLFANAGPDQTVDATTSSQDGTLVPTRVGLDAGASLGLDGVNQTFSWRRVSGAPRVTLDTSVDPTGRVVVFDALPVTGQTVYEFELTVGQGAVESKDRVRVTVFPRNQPPVLQKVVVSGLDAQRGKNPGEIVPQGEGSLTLRPDATDPDGDRLTTTWRVLTDGVPNPTATGDSYKLQWPVPGVAQVIVEATVTDPRGAVDSATVTIGVQPDPLGLEVTAPARVGAGEQVTARATPSRTRGVQVRWSVVSGTAPAGFPKTNRNITFNAPDVDTTEVVTLEVTATETATGATATRQVAFEVQAGAPLTVSVPPAVSVDRGEAASVEAIVDGPGNRAFAWSQTFGPDVQLDGSNARTVRFDAPDQATTIGLRLTVNAGSSIATANTVVTVGDAAAAPAGGCGDGSAYQQFADGAAVVLGGIAVITGFTAQGTNADCDEAILDGVDVILVNGLVVGDDLGGTVDQDGVQLTEGAVRLPDALRLPEIDLATAPIQIAFDGGDGGGAPPGPQAPGPQGGAGDPCIAWDAAFSSAQFPFVPLPPGFTGAGASVAITCTSAAVTAQAAAGGATFEVEGTFTAGGGVDATATLTNVPVLGGQASGTGSITVAPGGATTYDLSATVTNPSLPIPGLTLNTATARLTPAGLTIAADGSLGQGNGSLAVSLEGSFTNTSLSLAVEANNQGPWEVGPGLSVEAANLVGTVDIDAAGAAIVDLRLSVGGDWRPVPGLRVTGLSLQVANTAVPPECAIPAGGVWVRIGGQGAIDIPGVAPITLGVDSCLGVPTGGGVPPFSLRSTIGGAPWPIAPGVVIRDVAIEVSLVGGALTLEASGGATLLGLDLTARVLFLVPSGGGQPTVVVDAAGDLTGIGIPIPEAHVVFASAAVPDFEVAPGVTLDLPQGITGVGTIDLGQPIADVLNEAFSPPTPILPTVTVSISFGTVIEIKAAISLGGDGATLFMGCPGGGTACDPTAPTTTRLALTSAFIRLVLGGSGGFSIGFGADGTLNLPPAEAGGPASPLDLHVEASIQPPARVGLAMFFEGQWQNAMGLSGLTMSNLGIQGSIDFSTTPVPLVTIGITGQVDRVPDPLAEVLGFTNNGEPLRFTVNVDPLAPILELTLGVDNDQIVMRPLTAVGQPDALEVDFASVVIAPLGGIVGPVTYSPGVSIGFGADILDVSVHVNASVDIAAAHINGTVEIGSLTIGGVRFEDTTILLDITPQSFRQTLCGGVHIGNTTLQGLLHVQAGSGGGGPATCGDVTLTPGGGSPAGLSARFRLHAASLPIGPVNIQQLTVDAQAELDALSANFNATLNVTAQVNVLANNLDVDGTIKFGQDGVREIHVKAIGNVTVGGVQITGDGTCGFPETPPQGIPRIGGGGGKSLAAGGPPTTGACVQLDHAPGTATPFRFGLKGKLIAAGSTASIRGTLDSSQVSLSGTLNVPTLGTLDIAGTLVFGSGAQIDNATGTAVNASPGDWRVNGRFASAKNLAGGVSARWSFAAGRVSGGLFARGNAFVSIGGKTLNLSGTFTSNGSNLQYELQADSSASVDSSVNLGEINAIHTAVRGLFLFSGQRASDENFGRDGPTRGRLYFTARYDIDVTLTQSGLDIDEANLQAKVRYAERFNRDRDGDGDRDGFKEESSGRWNTIVNFNVDASGVDEFFEMAIEDAATRTRAATFCFEVFGHELGDC